MPRSKFGMAGTWAALAGVLFIAGLAGAAQGDQAEPEAALMERFEHLSTNGNSNCSRAFMEAIPTMTPMGRLQGSCCSPMDLHHYAEQVEGLKAYAEIAEIPRDPYDIPAGQAAKLLAAHDLELTEAEQAAYDYAMENSNEGGPCCCQCWRWHVYGGLAKLLIRNRGFTGEQVAAVWDLSEGCGGEHEH